MCHNIAIQGNLAAKSKLATISNILDMGTYHIRYRFVTTATTSIAATTTTTTTSSLTLPSTCYLSICVM